MVVFAGWLNAKVCDISLFWHLRCHVPAAFFLLMDSTTNTVLTVPALHIMSFDRDVVLEIEFYYFAFTVMWNIFDACAAVNVLRWAWDALKSFPTCSTRCQFSLTAIRELRINRLTILAKGEYALLLANIILFLLLWYVHGDRCIWLIRRSFSGLVRVGGWLLLF